MKLYEYTEKRANTTYIGVILADKYNKIHFDRVFSTNREAYPYLSGIEMAASYIKRNSYDKHEPLILYGQSIKLNDPVRSMYIEKCLPFLRVLPNTEELTEKDKELLLLATNRVKATIEPIDLKMSNNNQTLL